MAEMVQIGILHMGLVGGQARLVIQAMRAMAVYMGVAHRALAITAGVVAPAHKA
jgi:hypothetical protein